jgi:isopenicillin-N epimerase
VRRRCHALASETRRRIDALTGLEPICPDGDEKPGFSEETGFLWFGQFVAVRLPEVNTVELYRRLYEEYRIEVPVYPWNGQTLMRVSFQGYNDQEDADALVEALGRLLPELSAR